MKYIKVLALVLVSNYLAAQTTFTGILNHTSNYFTMKPYNASWDDDEGSYAKIFYDGKKKSIKFWNSGAATYTGLEVGNIDIYGKAHANSLRLDSGNSTISAYGFTNKIEFTSSGSGAIVFHPGLPTELMFGMHQNGNFYWGTGHDTANRPNYYSMFLDGNNGNLGIRGKLTANEVKVKLGGWSDFVFYDDYNLPTLTEVENHIKEKGHLKDIPSAKDVEENGILLGEMNSKLLQKIEELTLYTIAQEKTLENQNKKIERLTSFNNQLVQLQMELQLRLGKLENKK